jgi:DNA sulfur modification protein DndD
VKLVSIELENFRQFIGNQRIDFAQGDDEGNVTVVYGANGAGKTTLLNAFTWVMYGRLSDDIEQQERLITDAVWAAVDLGSDVACGVTLQFEHNGAQYRLRRSIRVRKAEDRQQVQPHNVVLDCAEDDGTWRNIDSYTDRLDQVLPERLARFFFFNGERIEHLVKRDAYQDIQTAIKTLLGLEQYERAKEHLPAVERNFVSEVRKLGKSRESDLLVKIQQEQDRQEALGKERQRRRGETAHLKDEVEQLEELLRAHEATSQLQTRRDEQKAAFNDAEHRLTEARRTRAGVLARQAYRIWLADLLPDVEDLASGLHERGELPAPLKRQFVEERLEVGTCICGTPLRPGGAPYQHVEEWRHRAGLAEVEGAWQQLRGRAKDAADRANEIVQVLQRYNSEIADATEARRVAEEKLNEIKAQLVKAPTEEGQELERRRKDVSNAIRDHEFRLSDIERELADSVGELQSLQRSLVKAHSENKKVEELKRRIAVTAAALEAIKLMLETASESVRMRLDAKVREVHSQITIKPFIPELNSSFELQLWNGEGSDRFLAPKSTGENQLLSLSFVGALAKVCQEQAERAHEAQLVGRIGGLYPIVMDAAFGNLDTNYRQSIARALPDLASQVVVLSSKSQADGVVASELAPHIGAEYVVTVDTTKPDASRETISLRGRDWDYVVPGADFDTAQIQRCY